MSTRQHVTTFSVLSICTVLLFSFFQPLEAKNIGSVFKSASAGAKLSLANRSYKIANTSRSSGSFTRAGSTAHVGGSFAQTHSKTAHTTAHGAGTFATTVTTYKEAAKSQFIKEAAGLETKIIRSGRNGSGKVVGVGTKGRGGPSYRPKQDGSYSVGKKGNVKHYRPTPIDKNKNNK